jgi:hypothetical protein
MLDITGNEKQKSANIKRNNLTPTCLCYSFNGNTGVENTLNPQFGLP